MNRHCEQKELRGLLDDTVSEPDIQTVEHLADCPRCQRSLEKLAAGDWWWTESRELVANSDTDEMRFASPASGIIAVGEAGEKRRAPMRTMAKKSTPDIIRGISWQGVCSPS